MSLKTLAWLLGGTLVLTVVARGIARWIQSGEADTDGQIQVLVTDLLAEALARKLGRPKSSLLEVLRGQVTDVTLRAKIEEILRDVDLTFDRQRRTDAAELRIDVAYRDGEAYSARVERRWDEVPQRVRELFLRTGRQVVTLPWQAPWNATR